LNISHSGGLAGRKKSFHFLGEKLYVQSLKRDHFLERASWKKTQKETRFKRCQKEQSNEHNKGDAGLHCISGIYPKTATEGKRKEGCQIAQ
jgi:hypothetical protein